MKFLGPLTLAIGLVAAVSPNSQGVSRKKARIPSPATLGEIMTMVEPTILRDGSGLASLPKSLANRAVSDATPVSLESTKRQLSKQDFYECQSSNPPPQPTDCNAIINSVRASKQDFILNEGTCLAFSSGTCTGYFCSLCGQLATHTDFIASQFESVQGLCVEGGQAGTIVGEDAPQYETGFLRAGSGVPTYDVCK
ncbi:hypothetical protein PG999_002428 [Apiospora kogelbergensis]|uniref:Cyanovirin-N domain-containing protein n=1 Tax=Apiospora kogelbergensis TaxID=1337665 RepID=A0AAW0R8E8_9PEZI